MVCGISFKDCSKEKKEHTGKFDVYIECTSCFHGMRKELDSCCIKPDKIFVNLPRADSKPTKREYCRNCGTTSPVIKMDPSNEYLTLPVLDKLVQKDTQSCRQNRSADFFQYLKQRREEMLEKRNDEFWSKYTLYLNSDDWKNKRSLVLKRDNNICQACLTNAANQVHHLTYERVFNEPLFDLVSICNTCHDKIHNKEQSA